MPHQSGKSRKTLTIAISALTAMAVSQGLAAQERELEEISITGSRIRDVGFTSAVPVTALNQEELNMFAPGLGVSQQLESLPQYFGNVSSDNIAGRVTADVGQSQLNMRGMGGERTLVLLDGSRIVPSDRRSSVGVDYLPQTLIRRVDVVTGGASAAYGSGAIAGVTNFILDRQFTGLEAAFRSGINEEGDGEFNRGSITFGRDFGTRWHVFGAAEARVNDGYRRGTLDDIYMAEWDRDTGYVTNPEWVAWRAANPTAPLSSAPVPLRLTKDYVYNTNFSPTGLISAPGSSLHRRHFTSDGSGVVPFTSSEFASLPGQPGSQQSQVGRPGDPQYDLWKRNHLQTFERVGVEAQTLFLGSDFQITDTTNLWGHVLWGRTKNTPEPNSAGGAGTGLGHSGLAFMTIYSDNFFLPDAVRDTMTAENRQSFRMDQHGYLASDWGYREKPHIVNRIASATVGFDTELFADWTLRGTYQFGQARKHNVNGTWERLDRFYLAVDAVEDPQNPGTPICRIQLVQRQLAAQGRSLEAELGAWAQANTRVFPTFDLNLDPGTPIAIKYPIAVDSVDRTISDCVPVNMFGEGNQSDAAMDYIFSSRNKTGTSTQEQHFAELLASGTLHEGWGAGPITAAVGATYREEDIIQTIADRAINELGPIYNVTLPDGTVAVRGVSPIINGSATNLHRFSDQPTFAGGYDVNELFLETNLPLFDNQAGQRLETNLAARWANYSRAGEFVVWKAGLSFQVFDDLRLRTTYSHDIREGSFEELFVQQGRGANVTDPWNNNVTYNTFNLTGGNPDIEAEEADTTVWGFVYQPSYLPGAQFSVDRYVVDLSSAIGTFREQQIVDQCFQNGVLCDRVVRSSDGFISRVITSFININAAKVSGWDFEASYRMEPDFFADSFETLNFRLLAGYMDENSSTPLGGVKLDEAGQFDLPKGTATAMVSYNIGNFGINVQQNWQQRSKRNVSWIEGFDVDDNDVPSVNLTNLGVFWNKELDSGTLRASLNINNLFDRDPVVAGTVVTGDELGRRYAIGVEYGFQ